MKRSQAPYVAVVGGVNIDIGGTPHTKLIGGDSNPGRISVSAGGVGRNIAENLSRMGYVVRMVTALGDDMHGQQIVQNCAEVGIDLADSITVRGGHTSTYLCLNDMDGEIVGAVSDMGIYEQLTPEVLSERLEMLNGAALVVLDANLTPETVKYLAEHLTVPIFADPVSVKKAGAFKPVLGYLTVIKPNRPEASLLTGVTIAHDEDLPRAAEKFFEQGLPNVLISLGERGVYYNDGRDSGILPCLPMPVVNTSGCGDAFLAGCAAGYLEGEGLREMARLGLAASAVCAQTDSAVSPDISRGLLEKCLTIYAK